MLASPLTVKAQQAGKVYRLGLLSSGGLEQENAFSAALRERLRERGWVEGQNLVVEWRYMEGKYERAASLIDDLVRMGPNLLLTRGVRGPRPPSERRRPFPL